MCGWFTRHLFNTIFSLTKIPTPFVSFWRHPCNSGWVPFGRLKTSKMCLKALPTSNGTRKLNQVLSFGKFFSLEIFKTNYHLIIESLSNIRKYVPLFLEKNKSRLTWLWAKVFFLDLPSLGHTLSKHSKTPMLTWSQMQWRWMMDVEDDYDDEDKNMSKPNSTDDNTDDDKDEEEGIIWRLS